MSEFTALEERLGVHFTKTEYLHQALVHRSYVNEHPSFRLGHNERLEFLGDAVLELAVTEHLYTKYENPEGDLTNWRAALVNAKSLGSIAEELEVHQFIFLSRGEAKDANAKARHSILANAFEAIVGAIYLDQGFEVAKDFIGRTVLPKLPYIIEHKLYLDPKSRLQEASQEKLGVTPAYKVLEEWGPDHNKHFRVAVYFGDEEVATGEGASKQEAQVSAAEAGILARGW
ncbi:MAG: ribonuclease III [Candidatus Nomurabacteria bacterium]|nr:MAG: ribonuclease III [Candidatus Nomurabacteria bacterium]